MSRKRIGWAVGIVAAGIAAMVVAFMGAGHFLVIPSPPPQMKADLIVTLGGGTGGRDDRVAALYAKGIAPKVLLTGQEGGYSKTRANYLNWRAQFLVDQGIPRSALLFDLQSASSWDEAVNTLRLMQSANLGRVVVVSDPPHMRRLSWVWGKVFAGSGKEYTLVASDMEGWDAEHWWRTSGNAQFVFAEYVKLAYYLVQYGS